MLHNFLDAVEKRMKAAEAETRSVKATAAAPAKPVRPAALNFKRPARSDAGEADAEVSAEENCGRKF